MNYIKYIVGAVILGAILWAGITYPIPVLFGSSTAGNTFNAAKFAGIVANLAAPGSNATSSSVLNSDSTDRYVTGVRYGCSGIGSSRTAYTGAGLASLQLTVGTTSTAAPAAVPSQAFLVASALVIATSSVNNTAGSSTPTVALGNAGLWTAGSYMTFWLNATNTAVCTFGVDYFGS